MSKFEMWKHMHRYDIVHVTAGMDILLALAVNWIRVDKQDADTAAAVNANSASAAAASAAAATG